MDNQTQTIDGLVVVVLAKSQSECFAEVLQAVSTVEVTLQQCHTQNVEAFSILSLHLMGHWHALAKLEISLPQLVQKQGAQLLLHRAAPSIELFEQRLGKVPYSVEWANLASADVLLAFCQFFTAQNIDVYEMHMQNVYTNPLGIGVSVSTLRLLLPIDLDIMDLREQFGVLCEALTVDAYLEPDHH